MTGWPEAHNILCVRLDTIGDVLMTGPALRALKASRPGRRLTLLTSPAGAEAASLMPEVDETITYQAPWMKTPAASVATDLAMVSELRERRFDATVIFTVYSQSPLPAAMLTYLAEVPLRMAYCRENPYHLLTDWLPEPEPGRLIRHEVQRQLDLVEATGATSEDKHLRLRIPEEARGRVLSILAQEGLDLARPWLVLHAGASAPSRCYPPESFAEVCNRLVGEDGWQVVCTGSEDETALVNDVVSRAAVPAVNLAGSLELPELAAMIECAPLLLANNTGPVRVAAATVTPVVVLYALTNPQHTPWMVPNRVLSHDVPCKYCYKSVCPEGHHACLRGVTPDEVVAAVRELCAETCSAAPPRMSQGR